MAFQVEAKRPSFPSALPSIDALFPALVSEHDKSTRQILPIGIRLNNAGV